MWVVMHADSQTVGVWTLLWRVCLFVLRSGGRARGPDSRSEGLKGSPLSTSFPATDLSPITLTLEVSRTPSTYGAQRWLLTSESGTWRDFRLARSWPSSAGGGGSWAGGGAVHFLTLPPSTLI